MAIPWASLITRESSNDSGNRIAGRRRSNRPGISQANGPRKIDSDALESACPYGTATEGVTPLAKADRGKALRFP